MTAKKPRVPKEPSENLEGLAQALAPIHERLDVHGEMLKRILQVLTEERESDGPNLYQLLADLIARIDGQSRYLKNLTVAVGKLGKELPLDLVQAIDDNLDISRRQNGQADEADPA